MRHKLPLALVISALVISALVASPAWALFDMYAVRCSSPQHGRDGLRLGFRYDKEGEAEACKALAEHLKQYPGHPARMYFAPDDDRDVPWDCVRHAPAKR